MSVVLDELDAVSAAPEHHDVLFENAQIRVLETLIPPGETTKLHTHVWGGSLYIISWSNFIRYDENGLVMADSKGLPALMPGTAVAASPLPLHALENVGTTDIHVILTEVKSD